MIHRLHKHTISLRHAFAGIVWAVKTQPNYVVHFILSFLSLFASILLPVSHEELLIVIVLIFVGLAIETVNTAIEKIGDAITKEYNADIKIAKDVSAGAMLFFAYGAFIIACIIFVPKIIQYIR